MSFFFAILDESVPNHVDQSVEVVLTAASDVLVATTQGRSGPQDTVDGESVSVPQRPVERNLVERSAVDAETAHLAACRKRRRAKSGMEHRASHALRCVLDGELSAGRQALEGAEVAPGTRETVDAFRERRPTEPREPPPWSGCESRAWRVQIRWSVQFRWTQIFARIFEKFQAGRSGWSFGHDSRAVAPDAREWTRH